MKNNSNLASLKLVLPLLLLLLAFWVYIFSSSLWSAVNIWWISEIFNHCFFIIPGAIFLIYLQRKRLASCPVQANYWLFIPVLAMFLLYGLGLAGDVKLFMHIATFCSLPLIIWLLIGNQAARIIAFPLAFMVFSIPIGEELIPWLQSITADISVDLLKLTQVPVFRTGLYIQIPRGTFLVAEACSGISFFIACIVIGTLYTHLNIQSPTKKIIFIIIAILYPIIANALRVYGIILTAHLTDMEYAAGADHLIYGGVFFAIVIISLLLIGELFRTKQKCEALAEISSQPVIQVLSTKALILLFFVMAIAQLWYANIEQRLVPEQNVSLQLMLPASATEFSLEDTLRWKPEFNNPTVQSIGYVGKSVDVRLEYFVAYYVSGQGELISSMNRLYHQDHWTIVNSSIELIAQPQGVAEVSFEEISDSSGNLRFLVYWYVVDEQVFADKRWAKLQQIINVMLGKSGDAAVVAFSQTVSNDTVKQKKQFMQKVQDLHNEFSQALPFGQAE